MPRPAPAQVAPGVHRLGDHGVNFYLIEDDDGLVLIDAGLPGHREQLSGLLADLGRSLADVRAVLLTHGHLDHTGLAHTLQQAGADIWVQQQDAAILHDGPRSSSRHSKPERSMLPYLLRRPSTLALPLQPDPPGALPPGAMKSTTFQGNDMNSIPPNSEADTADYHRPRVMHVPAGQGVVKWMSGDVYETMAPAKTTNGAPGFTDCWVPPGNGPVAHAHKSADGSFYLITGSLEFLNGDKTFVAHAGDFVFVPRGTRHRFRNTTDKESHMISFFTPGGAEAL